MMYHAVIQVREKGQLRRYDDYGYSLVQLFNKIMKDFGGWAEVFRLTIQKEATE
jgi:hypothetical protein